jgi:hypothetical protein
VIGLANYNEEMATLFKELGLTGYELKEILPEERATPKDWAELEERRAEKCKKNEEMRAMSLWLAEHESKPCL